MTLREVAAGEDLVGPDEIGVSQARLDDAHAGAAQQADHPLARHPVEEGARSTPACRRHRPSPASRWSWRVRRRGPACRSSGNCRSRASAASNRARVLLGYRQPALASTGATSLVGLRNGREGDRHALRHRHGRSIEAQAPAGGLRVEPDAAAGRPRRHRPSTSAGCRWPRPRGKRAMPSLASSIHRAGEDDRLQHERLGRAVDARHVQVEIGRHALEVPRPVEHRRAEPGAMRPRPHDGDVALVPGVVEIRPGLRRLPASLTMCVMRENSRGARSPSGTALSFEPLRHEGTPDPLAKR